MKSPKSTFAENESEVVRLEDSKGMFNCKECTENFSFYSWNDFKNHSCFDNGECFFECIYCGLLVDIDNGEDHVNMHFQHQYNSLYQCSLCSFSTSAESRFIKHIKYVSHPKMNPIFRCRSCQMEFESISSLIQHVKNYTIVMFNCCVKNCMVRTRVKKLILEHYERCHASKSQNLEITLFLACSEKSPDVLYTNILVQKYRNVENLISENKGKNNCIKELYLECPKCSFCSNKWKIFIRHYSTCTKLIAKESSIFLCSYCHSISTKKRLMDEHILECDKTAHTLTEVLPQLPEVLNSVTEIVLTSGGSNSTSGTITNGAVVPYNNNNNNEAAVAVKRSRSLSVDENDRTVQNHNPAKRARTNDSTESKCKTDEAINSDIAEEEEGDGEGEEEGDEEAEEVEGGSEGSNTEFVSIPFDEEGFINNTSHIPEEVRDSVVNKMRQLSTYQISIVGKENYGRIPQCPECNKVFNYGFGDFKRHFVAVHLDVEKDYVKDCLKYTRLPKSSDKYQEMCEQMTMRNMRPKTIDGDKMRLPLPYSILGLRKLTEALPASTQQYLSEKMRAYSTMSIIIQNLDNTRRFLCNQCTYSSPYALADVRKHIMGSHCGISTKHFRFCLQASRLDPNEFILLPDDKILSFAKDLTRRSKQKALTSYPVHSTVKSGMYTRSQKFSWSMKKKKTYRSHVTVKESNNTESKLLSQIGGGAGVIKKETSLPVSSGTICQINTSSTGPATMLGSSSSNISTSGALVPPNVTPSLGGRKGVNALYLNADISYNLNLPFSEPVLRKLLAPMIGAEQISTIIQKMKLYANYTLKRLCKNDRTVAFQCPCGRVFHTARIPDLKMRAATLADARRHVMGVHAKIPQSLITICCQASRICRENDFQIYSDDMLLQLASERQGKLLDSSNSTAASGVSSSNRHHHHHQHHQTHHHHHQSHHQNHPHHNISVNKNITLVDYTSLQNISPIKKESIFEMDTSDTIVPPPTQAPQATATATAAAAITGATLGATAIDSNVDITNSSLLDSSISSNLEIYGNNNNTPPSKITNSFLTSFSTDEENSLIGNKFSTLNLPPVENDEYGNGNGNNSLSNFSEENATARLETEKNKIERVIHLPYSLEALKCLTDGYCEPNFFPVLQEKMDIYSKYKIFIIRKDGRRVFCCSGCPSSSPHGMGDVKKHILGVHARIPERFKAAAMHCSRLSREDTSLLPDHLLLQLAKMKWKGSVIKPLSELSFEDRMKTFSKKNWDMKVRGGNVTASSNDNGGVGVGAGGTNKNGTGKKVNSKLAAVGNNNNDLSPLKKFGSMNDLTLKNDINTSSTNNNNINNNSFDELPDDGFSLNGSASEIIIPDEFHVSMIQKTDEEISYKCSICEYESRFVGNSKGHIVREHLGIPPHSCDVCDQLFNTRASAELHHEKEHSSETFMLTHYVPYKIAMSKIEVRNITTTTTTTTMNAVDNLGGNIFENINNINNSSSTNNGTNNSASGNMLENASKNSNSFLQNDFDLCLL